MFFRNFQSHKTFSKYPNKIVRNNSNVIRKPKEGINWDQLTFSLTSTDFMYVSSTKAGDQFTKGKIEKYGPLPIYPSATVLNYGQGIFEGIKAFRTSKDRIVVFRPLENHKRLNSGAQAFCMQEVPEEVFMDAVNSVVKENCEWTPQEGKGALYLRPMLFGDGPQLGVSPSNHYTFVVWASPVGPYFKDGQISPIDLLVSSTHHRAAPLGSGAIKAIGNYAPVFSVQKTAKANGFQEVLFLDSKFDRFVEEAGASNFFCVDKQEVIHTPALGAILPGITRNTVITLAKDNGIRVVEEKLDISSVLSSSEVFCSGTGASITPIGSITFQNKKHKFNEGKVGKITKLMYDLIHDIQNEKIVDNHNWLHDPYK
jgi:branched-chain amino acid aminotransferase